MLTNANIVAGSPDYDWGYHTDDAPRLGHNIAVPQGRVIGGSSAVDTAVAMRARPADFRMAASTLIGRPHCVSPRSV